MRNLIKYLLLFVMSVVFHEAAGRVEYSYGNDQIGDDPSTAIEASTFLSAETGQDICLPRQISSGVPARVQCSIRRTDNIQRQNLEFVKSGKVFNPNIRYFIQKTSVINHLSLADSVHKLEFTGKFII